jgi:hypothetical protein
MGPEAQAAAARGVYRGLRMPGSSAAMLPCNCLIRLQLLRMQWERWGRHGEPR